MPDFIVRHKLVFIREFQRNLRVSCFYECPNRLLETFARNMRNVCIIDVRIVFLQCLCVNCSLFHISQQWMLSLSLSFFLSLFPFITVLTHSNTRLAASNSCARLSLRFGIEVGHITEQGAGTKGLEEAFGWHWSSTVMLGALQRMLQIQMSRVCAVRPYTYVARPVLPLLRTHKYTSTQPRLHVPIGTPTQNHIHITCTGFQFQRLGGVVTCSGSVLIDVRDCYVQQSEDKVSLEKSGSRISLSVLNLKSRNGKPVHDTTQRCTRKTIRGTRILYIRNFYALPVAEARKANLDCRSRNRCIRPLLPALPQWKKNSVSLFLSFSQTWINLKLLEFDLLWFFWGGHHCNPFIASILKWLGTKTFSLPKLASHGPVFPVPAFWERTHPMRRWQPNLDCAISAPRVSMGEGLPLLVAARRHRRSLSFASLPISNPVPPFLILNRRSS